MELLCCDYLRLPYINLLILWDLLIFRCFPRSLIPANFIVLCVCYGFLYMYTVPRGGTDVVCLLWFYFNRTHAYKKQMLAQ
jgi:hypothetical protein